MCIKPEDAYIYGNYDTSIGRMIRVYLNKCTDAENNCKSEQDIDNFFTYKFLLMLTN